MAPRHAARRTTDLGEKSELAVDYCKTKGECFPDLRVQRGLLQTPQEPHLLFHTEWRLPVPTHHRTGVHNLLPGTGTQLAGT